MPKKLKIEYVKQYVSEISNGRCIVLSETYVNDTTELQLQCECGEVFQRKFSKIRSCNGMLCCRKCSLEKVSQKYRTDMQEVIEYINSTGCEYLDGEYKNNNSKLHIKCKCGNGMYKTFAKFKVGQQRCDKCYRKWLSESKIKFPIEEAKRLLAEREYTIVDEEQYKDGSTPIKCRCNKGHEFDVKIALMVAGHSGCSKCAQLNSRGFTNPHYIDGRSSVADCLRDTCNTWKKECKERYGNVCAVTGAESQRLTVHHLNSFSKLVEKASEETNVPVLKTISDYEDIDDFYRLKDKVFELNQKEEGIPLIRKVHSEFHKHYGSSDNTEKQFNEFLQLYYNTDLKEIKKKLMRKA